VRRGIRNESGRLDDMAGECDSFRKNPIGKLNRLNRFRYNNISRQLRNYG
jgi:hypothetical protein